ncbi:MAG: tetratricopeptide repeat protein [Halanaerobiales bacterium]
MKKITFFIMFILLITTLGGNAFAEISSRLQQELKKVDDLRNAYTESEDEAIENIQEALEMSEKLIWRYPKTPEVYVKAAACSSDLGSFDSIDNINDILEKGEEYADKAIELDPENSYAYYYKAALMGQIGLNRGILSSLSKVKPMRDALEKSLEFNPDFAPAYDVLAALYQSVPGWPISIGNKKKALENRIKCVELEPANFTYQVSLYELYKDMNKTEEAREMLMDFLESDIEGPNYTVSHEQIKEYARQELEKLEAEDSN